MPQISHSLCRIDRPGVEPRRTPPALAGSSCRWIGRGCALGFAPGFALDRALLPASAAIPLESLFDSAQSRASPSWRVRLGCRSTTFRSDPPYFCTHPRPTRTSLSGPRSASRWPDPCRRRRPARSADARWRAIVRDSWRAWRRRLQRSPTRRRRSSTPPPCPPRAPLVQGLQATGICCRIYAGTHRYPASPASWRAGCLRTE
ncbi:hypothetical protein D3C71_1536280 [compost metagenome]